MLLAATLGVPGESRGLPKTLQQPTCKAAVGLQAHIWKENHFPSTINLASAGDVDPWPWGFPSPVRLLIPTQRASVPKMLEEKKPSDAPVPRSDRSRSGLRTHCHAKPTSWTSPCYFMLFSLSGVPHYILTAQDVTEHQGATEPLRWKNVEKLYSTGLPLFSGVLLKEKEITQRGTFESSIL